MLYSRLLAKLNDVIGSADFVIGDFALKLAADPAYAFQWGGDAVKHAAARKVALALKTALEGGDGPRMTLEQLNDVIRDQLICGAKYPPQSTSPTSNLVEQFTVAAYAGWADHLRYEGSEWEVATALQQAEAAAYGQQAKDARATIKAELKAESKAARRSGV